MSFGAEVKRLREVKGITQKQLADEIGVSQPVIGRLEKSDSAGVQATTLFLMARALGVSAEHFAPYLLPAEPAPKPAKRGRKK